MLCALITLRHEMLGRRICWGVDNTTALSVAMHGYTLSQSMNPLISVLHVALAHLQCDVHFEYVPSTANPADLPSSEPSFCHLTSSKCLPTSSCLAPHPRVHRGSHR